jgi:hypothetical protein
MHVKKFLAGHLTLSLIKIRILPKFSIDDIQVFNILCVTILVKCINSLDFIKPTSIVFDIPILAFF